MSAWAKPGVKCVCIEAGEWEAIDGIADTSGPALDEVCTITWVAQDDDGAWIGLAGYLQDDAFRIEAFRPLVAPTQEQDVQMILSLLEPSEVPA